MSSQQMPAQQPTPLHIFRTIQGYQQTYILKAAVELGLFTAIAKGNNTAAAISKAIGASERGTRTLCDCLTTLEFLEKADGKYSLTPDSAFFLDERSPAYMGNALKFLLHPSQMEGFENMTERVRKGGAPEDVPALAPEDPTWVAFARGMAPLMVPAAQAIAALLQPHLTADKGTAKVLDIAAGHGTFGVTVAQRAPNAEIYAVDWANVLQVASENAHAHGVAPRHHVLPGSAFQVDYGTGYHAALVTNFLHHFDRDTSVELLRKVHASLKPGGRVVILEFVPNADRVSPPVAALFSAVMLNQTPTGDVYTFAELQEMCEKAGFEGAQLSRLDPMPQSLVVARKPN
jgi:2-polyprenyl-3-methyl-5-hydroxy-6-metoxy-1,4-benzoquinol methylase